MKKIWDCYDNIHIMI